MGNIKIINVEDEKNGVYRVVVETPKGVARMWITDDEYNSNKIKEISSNAASYLEQFKDEIVEGLIKYKNS